MSHLTIIFLSKLSTNFDLFLQNSAKFIRGSLILVQIFCDSDIILMKNVPVPLIVVKQIILVSQTL